LRRPGIDIDKLRAMALPRRAKSDQTLPERRSINLQERRIRSISSSADKPGIPARRCAGCAAGTIGTLKCEAEISSLERVDGDDEVDAHWTYPTRGRTLMHDDDVRAALQRHWASSDADDFVTEHQIYADQAVLEYPQSSERIRGRQRIQASRMAQPNKKRFAVRRVLGTGDLWISELVLTYDDRPFHVVSIMEFEGDKVVRETQYFAEPFEAGPSRAQWAERME
jgi:hypothetical protein